MDNLLLHTNAMSEINSITAHKLYLSALEMQSDSRDIYKSQELHFSNMRGDYMEARTRIDVASS
ncbi:hypothetical protein ACJX0J_040282, partial [Zea mays]